ncbi:MAG: glutathione S-transferase family protein [Deltaproteobacteria bacterium]|nr:glutathione S-transferase family protein [Myxococcales bacterium]MDP3212943.1 glutathione S-transferase family protein [Deltaproteobacteria bacterium]
MGHLIDGVWDKGWYTPDAEGRFERPPTVFRGGLPDGGVTEPGRFHLYAAYACPWAHRVLITRALKGLEHAVPVSVVGPRMGDDGWAFGGFDGATDDHLHGARLLRDVYLRARPRYTGRVTVPALWDTHAGTIVNNESREVMRLLDTGFDALARHAVTLYPAALRARIDETIDALYEPVNNGVYRAGFATTQEAYEAACRDLFIALEHWDAVLARQRYLCGEALTAADVCLFTTLLRFDPVYHGHFKCNLRRVRDYPNLWGFVRDVFQTPGVADTCRLDHIKTHYYWSHPHINPTRIVPLGPELDLREAHDRGRLGPAGPSALDR